MLISHRKRFIYTKTIKTASTSVEIFFERYCFPAGQWQESGRRQETMLDTGIVGGRAAHKTRRRFGRPTGKRPKHWFSHMSAGRVRDQIAPDIWNSYFKFTTIRNPFDKMISAFLMFCRGKLTYTPWQKMRSGFSRLTNCGRPIDRISGKTEIEQFRSWVKEGGFVDDRDKYFIDGEVCVDFFIRFENLEQDIQHVCDRISVPFDASHIPQYKAKKRHHSIPIRDYYNADTEDIVRSRYAWEFETFGYDMPGPDAR